MEEGNTNHHKSFDEPATSHLGATADPCAGGPSLAKGKRTKSRKTARLRGRRAQPAQECRAARVCNSSWAELRWPQGQCSPHMNALTKGFIDQRSCEGGTVSISTSGNHLKATLHQATREAVTGNLNCLKNEHAQKQSCNVLQVAWDYLNQLTSTSRSKNACTPRVPIGPLLVGPLPVLPLITALAVTATRGISAAFGLACALCCAFFSCWMLGLGFDLCFGLGFGFQLPS